MKRTLLILVGCILIRITAACSSNANLESTQTNTKEQSGAAQTNVADKTNALHMDGKEKTIVFTTFDYDDVYPKAKKYEQLHPNMKIELNYIPDTETSDPIARNEQFIQTLNTQLLSGKGPDLIDTSYLQLGKYVNRKLVMNLNELMEQDPTFKKEEYFPNILGHIKLSDGGIYGLPTGFYVDGLIGDEAAIEKTGVKFDDKSWSWNQFAETAKELVQKGNHKYAFFGKMPEHMAVAMVGKNASEFVDEVKKEAYFDTESFTRLLQQVKSLYDEGIVTSDAQYVRQTYFQQQEIGAVPSYLLTLKRFGNEPFSFAKPKLYAAPTSNDRKTGGYFSTGHTLSINTKSSVKAEAWDFIKFMLEEETGASMIPVKKTVYDRQVAELLKNRKVTDERDGKTYELTEQDIQTLNTFITNAIHMTPNVPGTVVQAVFEESKAYFVGQKSAEAVGKLIQNKVMLYLNE